MLPFLGRTDEKKEKEKEKETPAFLVSLCYSKLD